MKKLVAALLCMTFLILFTNVGNSQAASDSTIQLYLDGKVLKTENPPRVVANSTMVPLRVVSEGLGAKVLWNHTDQRVTVEKNKLVLQLYMDKTEAFVNGKAEKLDAALLVAEGTTLVPVRFVSENLGLEVEWNNITRSVFLTTMENVAAVSGNPDDQDNPIIVAGAYMKPGEAVSSSPTATPDFTANPAPAPSTETPSPTASPGSDYLNSDLPANNKNPEQALSFDPTWENGKYQVVIDAGHGGTDPGSASASGRKEKEFTLALVLKIAKILEDEPSIFVHLARQDDTFVERADRAKLANDLKADLFISIHGNSFTENRSVSGTETHYTREDSKPLADVLHRRIIAATTFKDRNVRKSNFQVTREASMPAVLCEIGFLSNPQEETTMWDEQFQLRVAEAIVGGIKEYLQIP
ncbi:N-acetylmuramoyl-L-alanine amidase [Paenibacillus sp. FSL L8-0436]|uniref:N-acetylmuramoyl-L-alanine amidase n=1 Tax=Paenibacillus sp. FSL L8-0436 TaxID=2954686 RepID=UPI0031593581